MKLTRRDFIKNALIWGGSLIFSPYPSYASAQTEHQGYPGYSRLEKEGKLAERVQEAYAFFEECRLCPRECGVNRLDGEKGFCKAPMNVMVYTAQPHFGEELSLVGQHGSGTIFFSNCNLRCVFCQNWPISIRGEGRAIEDEGLAQLMMFLQEIGCHNINLVTPTHVMPNILKATRLAFKKGLRIPLVYNTSGYERTEIIKLLDGIVDIYLPDIKYMDGDMAAKYSSDASDYPEMATAAVFEMNRQVGVAKPARDGLMYRGLMIRHLVMPNGVSGTREAIQWIAENLPKDTYLNLMDQYRPCYRADAHPSMDRNITDAEFAQALRWAREMGLERLDQRYSRF